MTAHTRTTGHHDRSAAPGAVLRRRAARGVVVPVAVLLAVGGLASCGEDEAEDEGVADSLGAPVDGPDVEGILGLDVTVLGDVAEVVDEGAFRLDKDGLDPARLEEGEESGFENFYYDYYDEEALTAGDEELVVEEPEGVLVIVPQGARDLVAGDQVRVSGTVRSLDTPAIEEVYGVELEPETYEPYENQLVLVAEDVSPAVGGPGA